MEVQTIVDYIWKHPAIHDENSLDDFCQGCVATYSLDFCVKIITEDCKVEGMVGFGGPVEELFEGGYDATAKRLREYAVEALWGLVMCKDKKYQKEVG